MNRPSRQGIFSLPLIIICTLLAWLVLSSLRSCICADPAEMDSDSSLNDNEHDNEYDYEDDYDENLPQKMGKTKKKSKKKKKPHKKGKKHDNWSGF